MVRVGQQHQDRCIRMTDWANILKHASPDVRELNPDVTIEDGTHPEPRSKAKLAFFLFRVN